MPVRAIYFTPCGGYVEDEEVGLIFHSMEHLQAFLKERNSNQASFAYDPTSCPPQTSCFGEARVPPVLLKAYRRASQLLAQQPVRLADFYPGWMPEGTPPDIEAILMTKPLSHFCGYYGSSYDTESKLVWLCWRDSTHHDHALFVSSQEGMRQAVDSAPIPKHPSRDELLTNAERLLPATSRWGNVELVGPMASLLVVHMRHVYARQ